MALLKTNEPKTKKYERSTKSSVKSKVTKIIAYLDRPINTERLKEIEEQKLRIQLRNPYIM